MNADVRDADAFELLNSDAPAFRRQVDDALSDMEFRVKRAMDSGLAASDFAAAEALSDAVRVGREIAENLARES